MSDVSLLSQSFWIGPRDMAKEESWLGVRGVSRKKGVSAGPGPGTDGGRDLALAVWDMGASCVLKTNHPHS